MPTRPRRFWPRFTLRVLLVFVTLTAISLGYWTHRAREQARIVKLIQDSGGMVCYEREGPGAPEPRNFAVEWLATILSRDYLEGISAVTVTDREVVLQLGALRGLATVYIRDDDLTDEDVAALVRCRELQALGIGDSAVISGGQTSRQIGDRSLQTIGRLPHLESVSIYGHGFTRQGIEFLAASPSIRSLSIGLCDESVTRSDFDDIKRLGRIQSLQAWRHQANDLGIERIIQW